jgi:hypothetical protein
MAIWLNEYVAFQVMAPIRSAANVDPSTNILVILILQLDSGEAPSPGVPRPHILMFFCNTSDESPRGRIVANVAL